METAKLFQDGDNQRYAYQRAIASRAIGSTSSGWVTLSSSCPSPTPGMCSSTASTISPTTSWPSANNPPSKSAKPSPARTKSSVSRTATGLPRRSPPSPDGDGELDRPMRGPNRRRAVIVPFIGIHGPQAPRRGRGPERGLGVQPPAMTRLSSPSPLGEGRRRGGGEGSFHPTTPPNPTKYPIVNSPPPRFRGGSPPAHCPDLQQDKSGSSGGGGR